MNKNNNHLKDGKQEFSFDTIENFSEHIELSIPNYSFVSEQIKNISDYFIEDFTNVYDIGCSEGSVLKSLKRKEKVTWGI